ncbi:MAG TPA: hypothetical protein VGF17_11260 [Phytomonospora sp.]
MTVLLGSLGRSDGGFWGVFLWSVVGFVVGSVVAIVMKGREPASPTGRTEVPGGQR